MNNRRMIIRPKSSAPHAGLSPGMRYRFLVGKFDGTECPTARLIAFSDFPEPLAFFRPGKKRGAFKPLLQKLCSPAAS